MRKYTGLIVQVMAIMTLAACATMPSPAGKWTSSVDTPQGAIKVGFEFEVDGKTLTGNSSNDFTGAIPIKEGMVNGKDLSFKVSFDTPGGAMTVLYKGVLEGDKLMLTTTFEGGPPQGMPPSIEMVADRVVE